MTKIAIIIGATSGLGREVAAGLIAKGWKVGVTGRRVEALEAFRNEFGADKVAFRRMDITEERAGTVLDELIAETGAPDLLLHVSGIGYQNRELDEEKDIHTIRTNCEGMVRIVDHFFNYVRNHPDRYTPACKAHIAVVTSVAGTVPLGSVPAYSASKKMGSTYITALVQLANMEKIPVQFTDIRPGFVRTDILDADKEYPMLMTVQQAGKLIRLALPDPGLLPAPDSARHLGADDPLQELMPPGVDDHA